jgi:dipeptidase E
VTGTPERIVVAMGGGGFSMEPENPLLDDHVLDLARANRGRDRPRVCFLGTASGDSPAYIASVLHGFRPSIRGVPPSVVHPDP